jgi:predicted transcriptional regulator
VSVVIADSPNGRNTSYHGRAKEESMRHLRISLNSDWKSCLRAAGTAAKASSYQGETLNFESASSFFGMLTERRWNMIHALQSDGGDVGVRELARRLGRAPYMQNMSLATCANQASSAPSKWS